MKKNASNAVRNLEKKHNLSRSSAKTKPTHMYPFKYFPGKVRFY